ncbi:MAG TPA: RNA 3'-terminal phosphate cyclase [Candidatus Nanoarchaeia archaeon]|nr:RNA 3'-terminal phosphate cyclase [Candidatus Nanoarchaeia archaeon]
MLVIDGSFGEAGGQILRTAVALSAIKKIPIKVISIRKGRPEPGLKAQHLVGIKAAAELCNANLTGAEMGSTEITFEPGKIKTGGFRFDVGTAGAITLVLQTLVPIAAVAPGKVKLEIKGGTTVSWSPPIEYFQNVYCDYLEKMGILVNSEVVRYGFYPKGGGIVKAEVTPVKQPMPLDLTQRGKLLNIKAWAIATKDLEKAGVAERMLAEFEKSLKDYKIVSSAEYVSAANPFAYIYGHALFENCKLSASALGERGKSSEAVGSEAALELAKEISSDATVDKHLADQLIPFLGLFGGEFITSEITEHTKTNIWVTEKFVDKKFKIEGTKISII